MTEATTMTVPAWVLVAEFPTERVKNVAVWGTDYDDLWGVTYLRPFEQWPVLPGDVTDGGADWAAPTAEGAGRLFVPRTFPNLMAALMFEVQYAEEWGRYDTADRVAEVRAEVFRRYHAGELHAALIEQLGGF